MSRKIQWILCLCVLCMLTACGKREKEPETVGEILKADFEAQMEKNADAKPQEIAEALLENERIAFQGTAVEVENGYLNGFTEEVNGFEEGVMFAPMISTIPFVGYIFTVPEGEDADTFAENLKNNADPRWNICTEAEETVVETEDNRVFFLMCPRSFEE